jgi:hypothetical protein
MTGLLLALVTRKVPEPPVIRRGDLVTAPGCLPATGGTCVVPIPEREQV